MSKPSTDRLLAEMCRADEIKANAKIARLRMALKPFADKAAEFDCLTPPVPDDYPIAVRLTLGDCRRAREALGE
jgi:hypothetical protein